MYQKVDPVQSGPNLCTQSTYDSTAAPCYDAARQARQAHTRTSYIVVKIFVLKTSPIWQNFKECCKMKSAELTSHVQHSSLVVATRGVLISTPPYLMQNRRIEIGNIFRSEVLYCCVLHYVSSRVYAVLYVNKHSVGKISSSGETIPATATHDGRRWLLGRSDTAPRVASASRSVSQHVRFDFGYWYSAPIGGTQTPWPKARRISTVFSVGIDKYLKQIFFKTLRLRLTKASLEFTHPSFI